MITLKDVIDYGYNSVLVVGSAFVIAAGYKKATTDDLGVPKTLMGIGKLAFTITGGSLIVKTLKTKEIIPLEIAKQ